MIQTPRLTLRHAQPDDLEAVHAIMSDPQVLRYWSTPPHESIEQTREWLDSMIEGNQNGSPDFIIEYDGRAIGKLGAWAMPEIGFYLARDAQGKGFANEALTAFIAYAFNGLTDHLVADVDPHNEASLKLLKGGGFVETGREERTWHVGGEWCDSVYLRLDKPQA